MASTVDRFWSLVDRSAGPAGCWPWRGETTARGYPVFRVRGWRTTARRYAWRLEHGDPGQLRVLSRCGTAGCCNVVGGHLAIASHRMVMRAAASGACRRCGRPLDAGNVYEHPGSGRRECRACKAARGRVRSSAGEP